MSKTVKILFVDDESARFKVMEDCRKTGKLNADVVDCTQPIIDIDWDNRDSVEIKKEEVHMFKKVVICLLTLILVLQAGLVEASAASSWFTDVKTTDWYYEPVRALWDLGVVSSSSNRKYNPNAPVTRAEYASFLWKMEGKPSVSAGDKRAMRFTDVKPGAWYYTAIVWANSKGLISGKTRTRYSPNSYCTIEESYTLAARYAYSHRKLSERRVAGSCVNWCYVYEKEATGWANKSKMKSELASEWNTNRMHSYSVVPIFLLYKLDQVWYRCPANHVGRINPTDYCTRANMANILWKIFEAEFGFDSDNLKKRASALWVEHSYTKPTPCTGIYSYYKWEGYGPGDLISTSKFYIKRNAKNSSGTVGPVYLILLNDNTIGTTPIGTVYANNECLQLLPTSLRGKLYIKYSLKIKDLRTNAVTKASYNGPLKNFNSKCKDGSLSRSVNYKDFTITYSVTIRTKSGYVLASGTVSYDGHNCK